MSWLDAPALRGLRAEWQGNQRLRWGVLAIALILAAYLFLVLVDWKASLQAQYLQRAEYLYKVRTLSGQGVWVERAQAARRMHDALLAQVPTVATVGLAQASVQSWARELVAATGGEVRVEARAPQAVDGQPGIWRVPIVLSGSLAPSQVVQLMQRIDRQSTLTVVEQANMLNRENRTFSLTIVSFFRIEQEPARAAG